MKRRLLMGLGNPLVGDDGVGCELASRLQEDPRLPADVEVMVGGVDLLVHQEALRNRDEILLLDAVLDTAPTGTLLFFESLEGVAGGSGAHTPDAIAAVALLRQIDPAIRETPVTLLGVAVHGARVGAALTPELASAVPALVDAVLEALAGAVLPA